MVKVIPQELATSMTENGHRRDMHPAEQIAGFVQWRRRQNTCIGDLLGYSPAIPANAKLADLALSSSMRWQKTASPQSTVRRWRWRTTPRVRCLKLPVSQDGAVNRKYRPFVVWQTKGRQAGNTKFRFVGLMPSRQMVHALICSATMRVAMWTVLRSMPPAGKLGLLQSTFGKPRAGDGVPDAWRPLVVP
nr:hypothetical protein [Escherichia coli O25b:H4-ST131]